MSFICVLCMFQIIINLLWRSFRNCESDMCIFMYLMLLWNLFPCIMQHMKIIIFMWLWQQWFLIAKKQADWNYTSAYTMWRSGGWVVINTSVLSTSVFSEVVEYLKIMRLLLQGNVSFCKPDSLCEYINIYNCKRWCMES